LPCSGNPPRGAAPQPDHIHERLARADIAALPGMTCLLRPDDIVATYTHGAHVYDAERLKSLFERPMLRALQRHARGKRVLDLGCGPGDPLGMWLSHRGFRLTGLDAAKPMLALYRARVAGAQVHHADMRHLHLRKRFDVLLAWDSFFHLDPVAQARMFPIFTAHAAPGAVLVFSSGPARGEAYGRAAGGPVYHASHDPLVYRLMLRRAGFATILFRPEDPQVDRHTWWLCRKPA
jgi:predicted TPR repeat methyltransferase